jgi:hypothetical protein
MKIIISDNQYGLLKESYPNKGINAIIKYWKKELEKGNKIRFDKDDLEYWGITKTSDKIRTQLAFQEIVGDEVFAKKLIKPLLNKTFSTKDFNDRIVGGYDFEWIITEMTYNDYDFYLLGKTLQGGTVTLMDGRHLSLNDAINDDDIGYEIQEEVNDVVQDCMNEIILPATGYEVEIPMVYIDEE